MAFLSKYRFCLYIPATDTIIGVSQILSCYNNGIASLRLTAGHSQEHEPLFEQLSKVNELQVFLLPARAELDQTVRRITVLWEDMTCMPLDLDATIGEVALENIFLNNVRYHNTDLEEVPERILNMAMRLPRG